MTTDTDATIKARDIAGELWEAAIRCDFDAFKIEVANAFSTTPSAQEEAVRSSIDVEALLEACVPGGSICDPQSVADSIRAWFAAQEEAVRAAPAASAGDQEVNDGR